MTTKIPKRFLIAFIVVDVIIMAAVIYFFVLKPKADPPRTITPADQQAAILANERGIGYMEQFEYKLAT